jgi:hypothetical protein
LTGDVLVDFGLFVGESRIFIAVTGKPVTGFRASSRISSMFNGICEVVAAAACCEAEASVEQVVTKS